FFSFFLYSIPWVSNCSSIISSIPSILIFKLAFQSALTKNLCPQSHVIHLNWSCVGRHCLTLSFVWILPHLLQREDVYLGSTLTTSIPASFALYSIICCN